jgi:hypothetical protein
MEPALGRQTSDYCSFLDTATARLVARLKAARDCVLFGPHRIGPDLGLDSPRPNGFSPPVRAFGLLGLPVARRQAVTPTFHPLAEVYRPKRRWFLLYQLLFSCQVSADYYLCASGLPAVRVGVTGLEPARPETLVPKTSAAANYATPPGTSTPPRRR